MKITKTTTEIDYAYHQGYGGVFTYARLLWTLWVKLDTTILAFTPSQRLQTRLLIILKCPYYLLIKPWACLFSTTTYYQGVFQVESINDQKKYNFSKVIKIKEFKILALPFWFYKTSKFSPADIQAITKSE